MKTGTVYFAFYILVILFAGCTGKKSSQHPENAQNNNREDNDLITLSIEDQITNYDNIAPGRLSSDTLRIIDLKDEELPGNSRQEEPLFIKPEFKAEAQQSYLQTTEENHIVSRHNFPSGEEILLKKGRTANEVYFTAVLDNDIWDYTDYYYTNGICLQLFHPAIGSSPFAKALPGLNGSINYYGISLVQNMYTPLKLEDAQPRVGDRPFASYLTLSHQRLSLSPLRHQRLQTELVMGVIGPASGGNIAQDMIHTNTPVGWVNQVQNDFVVNYSLRFDQGIVHKDHLDIAFSGGGQAGTLYDNVMASVLLRVGRANDLYGSLFQTTPKEKPFRNRIRYYAGLDLKQKMIIYDATLQGGIFNQESVYTIPADRVKRFVSTGTLMLGLGLGRYSLEAEQVYLSPEFDGGRCHFWFRIKNIIRLN
jgi:hypothetical protein